jgi:hypothetical protein
MSKYNQIHRKRGNTKRISFNVETRTGAAVDISSWTSFSIAVNTVHNPVDTSTQVSLESGIVVDGPNGKVYFPVTGTIPVGSYHYEIQALDENGEKDSLAEGKYVVTQDINKS